MVVATLASVGALPAGAQVVLSKAEKLTPRIDAQGVKFGMSVAVSGDTLVIGAPGDSFSGPSAGGAFVFTRKGSAWADPIRLVPADPAPSDLFGRAVAIDGSTILVGAVGDDDVVVDSGSVYVFVHDGSSWIQQAKLSASAPGSGDAFGREVAIDGDTAVIGAPLDNAGASNTGSAYIFARSGSAWTQQVKLLEPELVAAHHYGNSVGISGETAVVTTRISDDPLYGPGQGYVYVRNGSTWSLQATLQGPFSPTVTPAFGTKIGARAAILDDTIVMGMPELVLTEAVSAGAVRVFVRSGTNWTEQADLFARDTTYAASFGSSVAIDGNTIAVGTEQSGAASSLSGTAHVFRHDGTHWERIAQLLPADLMANDRFGNAIAVEGSAVVVGAALHDNATLNSGAVYTFDLD